MARKKQPGVIYKGNGFFVNIPARDLTPEEVKEYGGEDYLVSLGIYEAPDKPKPKKATDDVAQKGEED